MNSFAVSCSSSWQQGFTKYPLAAKSNVFTSTSAKDFNFSPSPLTGRAFLSSFIKLFFRILQLQSTMSLSASRLCLILQYSNQTARLICSKGNETSSEYSCRRVSSNYFTFQHPIRPNSAYSSFPSVFFSLPSSSLSSRFSSSLGLGKDEIKSTEFSVCSSQFGNSSLYFFIYFFRMKRCSQRKFFSKSSSMAGVVGRQVGELELFLKLEGGEFKDGENSSLKQQYL